MHILSVVQTDPSMQSIKLLLLYEVYHLTLENRINAPFGAWISHHTCLTFSIYLARCVWHNRSSWIHQSIEYHFIKWLSLTDIQWISLLVNFSFFPFIFKFILYFLKAYLMITDNKKIISSHLLLSEQFQFVSCIFLLS